MARRGRSEQEILREETGRARSGEEDGSHFTFAASRMEEKKRDTDIERRPSVEKPRQQTPLLSPSFFAVGPCYTHCHSQQLNQGAAKKGEGRITHEDHARRILHMDHRVIARRRLHRWATYSRGWSEDDGVGKTAKFAGAGHVTHVRRPLFKKKR